MPVTKYVGQTFKEATFQLEECWFINCILRQCTIFYRGGSYELENATFDNCQWKFQDQAQRTCVLLSQIGLLPAQQTPPQMTKLSTGPVQ
jgi:hypothetical protein